jgi:hypothetical protein
MVQGFIVDFGQGPGRLVSNWVEGAPEKSFWTGSKAPTDKCTPVGTFRCTGCGFLESYAQRQELGELLEEARETGVQRAARRRRFQAAGAALEQANSQALLERAELLAYGRLADAQRARGRRDGPMFDDPPEALELAKAVDRLVHSQKE